MMCSDEVRIAHSKQIFLQEPLRTISRLFDALQKTRFLIARAFVVIRGICHSEWCIELVQSFIVVNAGYQQALLVLLLLGFIIAGDTR